MATPISDGQPCDMDVGHDISDAGYNADRLNPAPGQQFYLHLSDLRLAMESVRSNAPLRVLDYGCGGSPYASLFPGSDYKRADYLATGRLDYVLAQDARVPEADNTFDIILSTQVLEHIERPEVYLAECYRLLKPTGRLVLSTHGTFPEHGCPYDYHRWTAMGLQSALEMEGFDVARVSKLTCGARALFACLDLAAIWLNASKNTFFGLALRLLQKLAVRTRSYVHRQCDKHFADSRQLDGNSTGDEASFYIALFAVAQKP